MVVALHNCERDCHDGPRDGTQWGRGGETRMRLDDKAEGELVGLENSSARATNPTSVSAEARRKDEWVTRKLGSNKERKSLKEGNRREEGGVHRRERRERLHSSSSAPSTGRRRVNETGLGLEEQRTDQSTALKGPLAFCLSRLPPCERALDAQKSGRAF